LKSVTGIGVFNIMYCKVGTGGIKTEKMPNFYLTPSFIRLVK